MAGTVTPLTYAISYTRNSAGGKPDEQERKNFTSKVHHANANTATPPTSFNLTAEQYKNLMTLLNNNKPNSMATHVGGTSSMGDLSGPTIGEDDWDGN